MLKILDRYILRKFVGSFLFTALLFTMVGMAIDLSEKVEKFIVHKLTFQEVLFGYYIHYIPYINGLLWPLYALIAVIFFTSRLAYNSEIISMFNAGMGFRRLIRPYVIGSFVFGLALLAGNHYIIPKANKHRLDFEHEYIWTTNEQGRTNNVHMFLKPGEKIYINFYRKADSSMVDVRLEQYDGQQLTSMLKARNAKWLPEERRWRLRNYEIRSFHAEGDELILGAGAELDTLLNIEPADFVEYVDQKDMMTTAELDTYIEKLRIRGSGNLRKYLVEKHRRSADPFTIIILSIIGVAVASRKIRGGMGLHLAIGVVIGASYIFLSRFSATFAMNQSLSPLLGVWIPNFLFVLVSIFMARRAQQ